MPANVVFLFKKNSFVVPGHVVSDLVISNPVLRLPESHAEAALIGYKRHIPGIMGCSLCITPPLFHVFYITVLLSAM